MCGMCAHVSWAVWHWNFCALFVLPLRGFARAVGLQTSPIQLGSPERLARVRGPG